VPDPPAPAVLEHLALDTARAAATLVAAEHGRARAVAHKSSPTDVVTQTDLDSERRIRELLAAATPGAGLLGEEGGSTSPEARLQWVVDPLDGTVNFLYGLPVVAVSIAAAVDGEVVAGAVVDVLRGEGFSAHLGGGARCDERPIEVSGCAELAAALVATGFSYRADLRARHGEIAHRLLSRARDLRCFGSSALELCWLACGRLDGYYERDIKPWDFAAGALIAEEAGAVVELPCPENEDLVLAAPAGLFSVLRAEVALSPVLSPTAHRTAPHAS
jgi:myo-inositol-1(or 4)-monophosphatase